MKILRKFEFFFIIEEYSEVSKKEELCKYFLVPFFLSLIVFIPGIYSKNLYQILIENSLTVISILTGFNLASLSIILSGSSESIKRMKEKQVKKRSLRKKRITFYKLYLIILSFTIVWSVFLIIFLLFQLLIQNLINDFILFQKFFISIDLTTIFSSLILTTSNVTNTYFAFFNEDK